VADAVERREVSTDSFRAAILMRFLERARRLRW
jgi:hypothetical protein